MRRLVFGLVLAVPVASAWAIGCSLGLDPSLINGGDAGDQDGSVVGDGQSGDALGDHALPFPDSGAGACMKDDDCKVAGNACISGARCDLPQHICVLDICKLPPTDAGTCQAAICDTKNGTCTAPSTYGFHATSFHVTDGATCGGGLGSCFAVVPPFAFVGTSSGVVAFQVGDPSNGAPPQVQVTGLTFIPTRIVSVDRRVFFLGSPMGGGSTVKIQVAWLDVPGTPYVASLAASSALIDSPPTTEDLFPTDKSSLFVVNASSPGSLHYPTSILSAPPMALSANPSPGIPSGAAVVASSSSRLVTFRWDSGNTFFGELGLVNDAGTASAQFASEQALSAMGTVYGGANTFLSAPDGSVLWMTASASIDQDAGTQQIVSARMAWVLAGPSAMSFDASQRVDVEVYSSPLGFGSRVAGPMAWIDPKTVVVLAADKGDQSQTSVQVASRSGATPTIVGGKRFVIGTSLDRVAAVGAGGFAWVLAGDVPNTASDASVHIIAPGCD